MNPINKFTFQDVDLSDIYWTISNYDYRTPILCFCYTGVPKIQVMKRSRPKGAFVFEDLNNSDIDPLNPENTTKFEFIISERIENINKKWVKYILDLDMGDGENKLREAINAMMDDSIQNRNELGPEYCKFVEKQRNRIIKLIEKVKNKR